MSCARAALPLIHGKEFLLFLRLPSPVSICLRRSGVACLGMTVVGCVAALLTAWYYVSQPYPEAFLARTEFGPVESLTSYLWLLPAGAALGLAVTRRNLMCGLVAWTCLLLLCRELDLHKLYTLESLSSTRYWRSGLVSLWQKLLLGTLLLASAWIVFTLARKGFRPLVRALQSGGLWSSAFLAAIALGGLASLIDNLLDMDALDDPRILFFSLLEESLEMVVPVFLALAVILWAWHGRRGHELPEAVSRGG